MSTVELRPAGSADHFGAQYRGMATRVAGVLRVERDGSVTFEPDPASINDALREMGAEHANLAGRCPACIANPGWAHGDESKRREPADVCRTCYGSGSDLGAVSVVTR